MAALGRLAPLLAGAALALALAGCGLPGSEEEGPPASGEMTPTPPDAADLTPTAVPGEIPRRAPDELVNRLLGGESLLPGLPAGFHVESTETSRADMSGGAERVLVYAIAGPDFENSVTCYIYGDASLARSGYSKLTASRQVRADTLDGLGYPAKTISYGSANGSLGYTAIYVLAGQIVIEAVSGLQAEVPAGEFVRAYELAAAALAHVLAAAM